MTFKNKIRQNLFSTSIPTMIEMFCIDEDDEEDDGTAERFFDPEEMDKHALPFGQGDSRSSYVNASKDNDKYDPYDKIEKTGNHASIGFKQGLTMRN